MDTATFVRKGLVLAFAYYVTAFISLRVALVDDLVTPIWPPTGIAVVCLLVWGRKLWPWITLAALAVNLFRTPTPLAAMGLAAGNTLAPLVAVTLLRRVRFNTDFRRMSDAFTLVGLGALASMAVSATAGTATLALSGAITPSQVAGTWSVWWAGDALGVLVFAPLLLSFQNKLAPAVSTPARKLEAVCVVIVMVATAGYVFQSAAPLRYLLFPLLVWAALRFGVAGAAVGTLIVAGYAVAAATAGTDPLAGDSLVERMLLLQLTNAAAALTSFVLATSWSIRHRSAEDLRTEAQRLEAAVEERTAALKSAMAALEREMESRTLSERSLAERERQLNEAESLAHVGSWSWDIPSDTISWSDELFRIYGLKKQEAKLAYRKYLAMQHPEDREVLAAKAKQALKEGAPYRVDHRIVRPDGEVRWIRGEAKVVMGADGPIRLYGAAQDFTEQKLAEDRLRQSEERYRGLVEQAPEAILVMDLDSGTFVEVNRAGEQLLGRSRDELVGTDVHRAMAPAQPDGRTVTEVGREMIEQVLAGQTPQFEWMFLHSSGRPVLCDVQISYLPAAGRRLVRGSLTDITERRRMERALQEAQEKERQLREQRHIAHTLQRSLLPETLSQPPGVKLAVRYLPGSKGLEVGGDWYDAFELPGGSLAVVVGDIVGRGLKAAATMGQLRTALRAYALQDRAPRVVLQHLAGLVENLIDAEMATLVYAVYDRKTGVLTYSCAGHPPPLLVPPAGEVFYLNDGRSPPMGVPDLTFCEASVAMETGSVLLLYTDGLVERRGTSIDDGLADLARVTSTETARAGSLEELTSRILAAMDADDSVRDDTALLAMAVTEVHDDHFTFSGPAEPESLSTLRRSFTSWLDRTGPSPGELQDLVLAVTEAAANSVLHAFGPGQGAFEVRASKEGSVVSVDVYDRGSWRTRRTHIGGRGLKLVRALVHSVHIDSNSAGTRVTLQRHLGRPLPAPERLDPLPELAETDGEYRQQDLVPVVELSQEIDVDTSQQIGTALLKKLSNDKLGLVLDLTTLQFLDSSGLGMLLGVNRRLDSRRMQLRVVVAKDSPVDRILAISQVGGILPICHTVEEAVDSILRGQGF